MVSQAQLQASKEIQRRTGRTFHVATRFLPERTRQSTYVLYAFFRMADDIVDDPDPEPAEQQRAELERLREVAIGERSTDDAILSAFAEMRANHDIPAREIDQFIDAMEADIEPTGYDTYVDLEGYLRGSAVAVAYMMLAVMDPEKRERARPHAKALAEAFQLTNFLRDVREDITEYGRIYVPRSTLARHGVSEADITNYRFSDSFGAVIRTELRRTEKRYRKGVAGIRFLPEDCQFPVLLAAVLYAEYHRLIREREYDVLSSKPSLPLRAYVRLLARTWWHWKWSGDPEAVFFQVSAVGSSEQESHSASDESTWRAIGRSVERPVDRVVDLLSFR